MMNVLLITTDEQRFDALGCTSDGVVKTPNIDRIARRGVRFDHHTCSSPICTPARVSILTGQYSRTHGAINCSCEFSKTERALPHWMAEAGYRTGIAGKSHFEPELSGEAERLGEGAAYYGFHEAYVTEDIQSGAYLRWVQEKHPELYDEVRANGHEDVSDTWGMENGRLKACYKSRLPDDVHQARWITDKSIDFIGRSVKEEKPFFLWTSYVGPHHPWNPIEPYASMYNPDELPQPLARGGAHDCRRPGLYNDASMLSLGELQRMRAAYFGMISHIDHHVGRILDELERADVAEDTIIIFTSDHGDYNGERWMIRKLAGAYEDVLRVPMLVSGPGIAASSVPDEQLTQHEDIAPTILSLLGLPVPKSVQGRAIAGLGEYSPGGSRSHSFLDMEDGRVLGVCDGTWKLVHYQWEGKWVLTNLQRDPMEKVNLYEDSSASGIVRELKVVLTEYLARTPVRARPGKFGY